MDMPQFVVGSGCCYVAVTTQLCLAQNGNAYNEKRIGNCIFAINFARHIVMPILGYMQIYFVQ